MRKLLALPIAVVVAFLCVLVAPSAYGAVGPRQSENAGPSCLAATDALGKLAGTRSLVTTAPELVDAVSALEALPAHQVRNARCGDQLLAYTDLRETWATRADAVASAAKAATAKAQAKNDDAAAQRQDAERKRNEHVASVLRANPPDTDGCRAARRYVGLGQYDRAAAVLARLSKVKDETATKACVADVSAYLANERERLHRPRSAAEVLAGWRDAYQDGGLTILVAGAITFLLAAIACRLLILFLGPARRAPRQRPESGRRFVVDWGLPGLLGLTVLGWLITSAVLLVSSTSLQGSSLPPLLWSTDAIVYVAATIVMVALAAYVSQRLSVAAALAGALVVTAVLVLLVYVAGAAGLIVDLAALAGVVWALFVSVRTPRLLIEKIGDDGFAGQIVARLNQLGSATPRGVDLVRGSDTRSITLDVSKLPGGAVVSVLVKVWQVVGPRPAVQVDGDLITEGEIERATLRFRHGRTTSTVLLSADALRATGVVLGQDDLALAAAHWLVVRLQDVNGPDRRLYGASRWESLMLNSLAGRKLAAGDVADARAMLAQAVEVDPDNLGALFGLASVSARDVAVDNRVAAFNRYQAVLDELNVVGNRLITAGHSREPLSWRLQYAVLGAVVNQAALLAAGGLPAPPALVQRAAGAATALGAAQSDRSDDQPFLTSVKRLATSAVEALQKLGPQPQGAAPGQLGSVPLPLPGGAQPALTSRDAYNAACTELAPYVMTGVVPAAQSTEWARLQLYLERFNQDAAMVFQARERDPFFHAWKVSRDKRFAQFLPAPEAPRRSARPKRVSFEVSV